MSHRGAYARWCHKEVPMVIGAFFLLLAPLASLSVGLPWLHHEIHTAGTQGVAIEGCRDATPPNI